MPAFILTLMTAVIPFIAGAETAHPGGFPTPVGPIAQHVTELYNFIFWIITVVAVLVATIMAIIIVRFRRKNNPKPAKFSHNTPLEVVWTVIPAIICVILAWKSYEGLVYNRTIPEEGMTVEVVAYQFGWDFYYPDFSDGETYVTAAEPAGPHPTLSLPDTPRYVKELVVPVDTVIKLHITASDVIHAFYSADLGIKVDAMPGRINYLWFEADKLGNFIGQCAELCGSAHGEMFFSIKVVSQAEFVNYVNARRGDAGLGKLTAGDVLTPIS